MTAKTKGPERKEYTLAQPHIHHGDQKVAGDKVQLTARQAEFIKHKLAETGKAVKADKPAEEGDV